MLDLRMKCLSAALAIALLTLGGCAGPAVTPTTYETYNAQEGAFAVEYPANWQVTSGGTRTYPWVKIASGSAEVDVDADSTGSVLADIAKSQVPMLEIGDHSDAPPIQKLHESDKEALIRSGAPRNRRRWPWPRIWAIRASRNSRAAGC